MTMTRTRRRAGRAGGPGGPARVGGSNLAVPTRKVTGNANLNAIMMVSRPSSIRAGAGRPAPCIHTISQQRRAAGHAGFAARVPRHCRRRGCQGPPASQPPAAGESRSPSPSPPQPRPAPARRRAPVTLQAASAAARHGVTVTVTVTAPVCRRRRSGLFFKLTDSDRRATSSQCPSRLRVGLGAWPWSPGPPRTSPTDRWANGRLGLGDAAALARPAAGGVMSPSLDSDAAASPAPPGRGI